MLHKRPADLNEIVWGIHAELGTGNPGRVTDAILADNFPRTHAEAEVEGVEKLFRNGLLQEVKSILATNTGPSKQRDFSEIDPAFSTIVRALKRPSYWVESREELVAVAELIEAPDQLDDARKFMRRKGMETLEEAGRLDQLHAAVVAAKGDKPATATQGAAA